MHIYLGGEHNNNKRAQRNGGEGREGGREGGRPTHHSHSVRTLGGRSCDCCLVRPENETEMFVANGDLDGGRILSGRNHRGKRGKVGERKSGLWGRVEARKKVDRLRPAIDDVRRTELESLGRGQGCGWERGRVFRG